MGAASFASQSGFLPQQSLRPRTYDVRKDWGPNAPTHRAVARRTNQRHSQSWMAAQQVTWKSLITLPVASFQVAIASGVGTSTISQRLRAK